MSEKQKMKDVLVKELKDSGLDIAEDAAVIVAKGVLSAISKLVIASDNKVDDLLIPVLEIVKPKILDLLDKIDGKDDIE